jgi:magnesium transporter
LNHSSSPPFAVLRPAPRALISQRLEQRPADPPSGLFVHGGRQPTRAELIVFEAGRPVCRPLPEPSELAALRAAATPLWLRIQGVGDRPQLDRILDHYAVPELLRPPLLEMPQRPRVECLGEVVLVVLHRFRSPHDPTRLVSDQVGFLLLPGLLVTVEEAGTLPAFPALTDWLLTMAGPLEDRDLDDILHHLIDDLLDDLFPILEHISNRLDDLEEATLRRPRPSQLTLAFQYRSNVRRIRRQIWPLRHQIRLMLRQHQSILGPEAVGGFQDMAELVELLYESSEALRGHLDAITEAYAASISNRMNQVMKTLTILTSIFAPLTFIAGIYGMNFEFMPELKWRHGYLYVLLLMALVGLVQSYWLQRRGWFQDWTAQR